jgi:uncharacterized protein YggU (UPF0235/DUF167 family)
MIAFEARPEGVVIPIRAHAGALRVEVTAAPEKGKANGAIIAVLAEFFQLPKSAVELIAGAGNPQKRFLLHGIDVAAAQSCAAAANLN